MPVCIPVSVPVPVPVSETDKETGTLMDANGHVGSGICVNAREPDSR